MSDKTIDLLRRMVAQQPGDAQARAHLAELLAARGDDAEALRHAQEALRLAPDDAPTHLLAARLHAKAGGLAEAEEHYFRAVQLQPDLEDADLLARIQAPASGPGDEVALARRVPTGPGRGPEPGSFAALGATTSFADVGGMEEVKEALRMHIVLPLQKPEMFRGYGKKPGGGVLMYGPPGCGKSYLARASAGECGAAFFALGLHDILDMWIGQSERNLHALFAEAKRRAPAIVFLDEIDALGAKRSDHTGYLRSTVNTLLVELDGLASAAAPVLAIGATNTPWSLDTALKRPGRFDRIVFVPPPDEAARREILALHLRGRPAEGVDVEKVARKLDRFSGADLRAVVEGATETAIREAMKAGRKVPITTRMLLDASARVKPSTAEWLETARDYAKYSNQSGLYDPVLDYLAR